MGRGWKITMLNAAKSTNLDLAIFNGSVTDYQRVSILESKMDHFFFLEWWLFLAFLLDFDLWGRWTDWRINFGFQMFDPQLFLL